MVPTGERTLRLALIESAGYVVAVRNQHPILARSGGFSLDEYLSLAHVRVSSNPRAAGLEDLALARVDRRRRIALRCQSFAAGCRVVAATDIALTLPAVCAPLTAEGRLRLLPLPFAMEEVPVYLYWHASNDADPANAWLRSVVMPDVVRGAWEAPFRDQAPTPARSPAQTGSGLIEVQGVALPWVCRMGGVIHPVDVSLRSAFTRRAPSAAS